ncbi:hypothetical protein F7R06_10365 [Pseudomonas moorei]|nr:hypothetical protein F7R06_10365 [Pseudomonas moorei]
MFVFLYAEGLPAISTLILNIGFRDYEGRGVGSNPAWTPYVETRKPQALGVWGFFAGTKKPPKRFSHSVVQSNSSYSSSSSSSSNTSSSSMSSSTMSSSG